MHPRKRIWIIFPLMTLLLTACSAALSSTGTQEAEILPAAAGNRSSDAAPAEETPDHQLTECEDPFGGEIPAFRTDGWETNFCLHSVDYAEIFSGGPPRDGIPPLDSPRFESIASADLWIEDIEPVILLDTEGEARAYPLQILTWHEIVNDQVGEIPVAVTFCPLCNTALVFVRPEINGEILTFGTSGNLRYSDLVMWDRQTESWWQQFNGEAIIGDLLGTKLERIPSAIISWSDFKSNYPDGLVLSIQTGFQRSYGRNPYAGYDNVNSHPFAYVGDLDGQLPAMARVVGVNLENGEGGAFALELLQENRVLNEKLGDVALVLFWKPGTASALESSSISNGRDVGTTGVFAAAVDGQTLTFEAGEEGQFLDKETRSTWDIFGKALDGPLAGSSLERLAHHDTFWFAWAAFVPDSELSSKE